MERIVVGEDGKSFSGADSGRKFTVWGVNYDHDGEGRLLEDYWEKEWQTVEDDFREIKELGANTVRIHLQIAKFMKSADAPDTENLARLVRLLALAEKNGLYLDITGLGCYHKQDVPPWYDKLDEQERWKAQSNFWHHIATTCRDSPAVFCYDLMNEPVLAGGKVDDGGWLTGELGGKFYVQRITRDLAGRTREEVVTRWIAMLSAAIRKVDDSHLITVGVIPWAQVFKGAKPLFHAPEAGKPLDFVSVHFYPESGKVDEALEALKVYELGKPLIIEEIFPLKASLPETADFIARSATHCDGWVSFYWGKTIKENLATKDLKGALVADWLRLFQKESVGKGWQEK